MNKLFSLKYPPLKRLTVILFGLVVLHGCTTTRLTSTWMNQSHTALLKKVLVVVEADKEVNRRIAEDEIAAGFVTHGVEATPGNQLITKGKDVSEESVKKAILGKGFDSVLHLKVISVDKDDIYVPPTVHVEPYYYYRPHLYGGHSSFAYAVEPGYYKEEVTIRMEVSLFNTENGELIWSAISETKNPGTIGGLLPSLKKKIFESLTQYVLIK